MKKYLILGLCALLAFSAVYLFTDSVAIAGTVCGLFAFGAITQTAGNKTGLTLIASLETGSNQNVYMYDFGGIKIGFGSGSPDADITAPIGSMWINVANGRLYLNEDGATQWNLVGAQSLTDTPAYAGERLELDGKEYIAVYSDTKAAGEVQQLTYLNTAGRELSAVDCASTAWATYTIVSIAVIGTAGLNWWQIGGLCEALVEGTTDVAAGDFLEVLNTEIAWKKDGTVSANSGAVAIDAVTDAGPALATVFLINKSHVVAAS